MAEETKQETRKRDRISYALYVCYLLMLLAGIFLAGHFLYLKVFWKPDAAIADKLTQPIRRVDLEPTRGSILASDGRPIAMSYPRYQLYIDPWVRKSEFEQMKKEAREDSIKAWKAKAAEFAKGLAIVMPETTPEYFYKRLSSAFDRKSRYLKLGKPIEKEQYEFLKSYPLIKEGRYKGGVWYETVPTRRYPYGALAKRTIGSVTENTDGSYYSGIDGKYNYVLHGTAGRFYVKKTDNGYIRDYDSTYYNYRETGMQLTNVGNEEIKWETTSKLNVGLQANFLNNRLGATFNYFIHNTTDLLTLKTFANPIGGINNYWSNDGELRNTGFEVGVNAKPVDMKDWHLELGATVGHYKNEVRKLANGSFTTSVYGDNNILTSVGNPVGVFYGYKTNGVFATTADAQKANLYVVDKTGARQYFAAGDVIFEDVNHDGQINEADKVIIGDPTPDIYGNIFLNLNWKRFTLNTTFNYSLGNDVYNYQRSILNSGATLYNQQVAEIGHWRYEGQQTNLPRVNYGDPMGNNRFSDRWIEDGSYLRLKSAMLTYQVPIPDSWQSWLQGISVWAEGRNLLTLTKYTGSDPEFSLSNHQLYQGIDCGNIAQGRVFSMGVKINL